MTERFGSHRSGELWHSPAAERNLAPILNVVRDVLPATGTVLEVASGSGQHVVALAQRFPALDWQPSEIDPDMQRSIRARREGAGVQNLRDPLHLDAFGDWPAMRVQGLVAINLLHIASWAAAGRLFSNAARVLEPGAPFYLYGPYRREGAHTSEGNRRFDASLKERNPEWGIRDLEAVIDTATAGGFRLDRVVDMPSNNLSVVFIFQ